MKTNAIVRIVLFSLAILILLGILIAALCFNFLMFDRSLVTTTEYPLPVTSDGYSSSGAVNAEAIRNIDIEWAAGTINISPRDDIYEIIATETNGNEKHQMVYAVSGDTLKIKFSKDTIKFPSFGITVNFTKDLLIEVPSDWYCNDLEIDAAAVDVYISNMSIGELNFDGASGALNLTECDVTHLDADTASGNIQFSGTLGSMDCDAASADCNLHVFNVPREINLSSMSGDLNLTLPENCGFTCFSDTLSGNFHSDFFTTVNKNGNFVYGDGACRITVDGVSSDVSIKKHAAVSETIHNQDCTDPNCTDASHDHGIICNDSNCTDTSHNHPTNHTNKETHQSKTEHY